MSINVERKYIMGFLEKVFGTYSEREVKKLQSIADKIEALDEGMQKLTDEELSLIHI